MSFDLIHQEYTPYVKRLARRFARGDRDAAQDLEQEAWLALLLTPEQHWTEPRYVRAVIYRAMCRWLSSEAVQRGRTPATVRECHSRRRPQQTAARTLRFRRNVPRHQLSPDNSPQHDRSRRRTESDRRRTDPDQEKRT